MEMEEEEGEDASLDAEENPADEEEPVADTEEMFWA